MNQVLSPKPIRAILGQTNNITYIYILWFKSWPSPSKLQHPTASIFLHHAHPAAIALALSAEPFTELAGALKPEMKMAGMACSRWFSYRFFVMEKNVL